ncbi:Phosphoglucomutase [compost metagenome]
MLLWLNILARRIEPVDQIMAAHWLQFGRNYYSRHDYEAVPSERANALIQRLRDIAGELPGQQFQGLTIESADDFAYHDPVDGSVSKNQGIRISFADGSRVVLRLSGTGTEGATLRVYLERYEAETGRHDLPVEEALAPVIAAAEEIALIREFTGRDRPDVTT